MTSEMERLDKYRSQVRTRSGPASYVDTGGPGRPVLFVHGVGTSSYLWRNVIAQLDGERRCVAVDLPLHGYTPAAARPGLHAAGAGPLRRRLLRRARADRLRHGRERHRRRRHPGIRRRPPRAAAHADPDQLRGARQRAAQGAAARGLAGPHGPARPPRAPADGARQPADQETRLRPHLPGHQPTCPRTSRASGWKRRPAPRRRPASASACWPRCTPATCWRSSPRWRRLQVPTLIVWGTDDIFFRRKWAYWLRDTIPGATEVVEIDGGRLFFPDERAAELTAALRRHWDAHP